MHIFLSVVMYVIIPRCERNQSSNSVFVCIVFPLNPPSQYSELLTAYNKCISAVHIQTKHLHWNFDNK